MVCPNCGAEMKDGSVFCEKCGKSIQIVPNFEPEIEERIDETLSAIVDDVLSPKGEQVIEKEDKEEKKNHTGILLFLVAVAAMILVSSIVYFNNTYSAYLKKGISYEEAGSFEQSVTQFEKAIRKDKGSVDARLHEANAYRMLGNNDAALRRLYEVIDLDAENEAAYNAIIAIYEETENYTAINSLLEECTSDAVYEKNKEYMALPPEFSEEEGTYEDHLTLKLMTDNSGTIYYTLDGSEPTKDSLKYTAPLELNKGKNVVRAIFVNDRGIVSDSISKIYEIDLLKPDAPVISPSSGGFITPDYIEAVAPENCEIFYTTDGTTPNENSQKYMDKLPMPIGNSHFKFIAKSKDNLVSDVVDANYTLTFTGACTREEAANFVTVSLVATGHLLNVEGAVADKDGLYKYICDSAVRENGRVYYMVQEVYQASDGTNVNTEKYYAVDAYDCSLHNVKRDENQEFMMSDFE